MAARRTNPSYPATVRPVYEEFKPISEWRQEQEAEILLIYLPGFLKANIKVTTEDGNTVRVRGERLVAGNKWHRFQEDFRVPENCIMAGIRAKFEGGVLRITMPRKSNTQDGPKVEAKATQEASRPQKPTSKPKSEAVPTRTTATTIDTKKPVERQKIVQSPPRKEHPTSHLEAATPQEPAKKQSKENATQQVVERQEKEKTVKHIDKEAVTPWELARETVSQKGQSEIISKRKLGTDSSEKQRDENVSREAVERQEKRETTGKAIVTDAATSRELAGEPVPQKGLGEIIRKPIIDAEAASSRERVWTGQDESAGKVILGTDGTERQSNNISKEPVKGEKASKRFIEKLEEKGKSGALRVYPDNADGSGVSNTLESYKYMLKRLASWDIDEERQLVLNMGVAALVIVALGAYIFYTSGTSGQAQD